MVKEKGKRKQKKEENEIKHGEERKESVRM